MADPGFTRLGSRRVVRGDFLTWERLYLRDPTGGWLARDTIRHPGSVVVVPWDGDRIHFIEQYRAPVGEVLRELPAGKLDVSGEQPEITARRELVEELGLLPGRLTLLHGVFLSPGFTDERSMVYLAEDLEAADAAPQGAEEEHASLVSMTPEQARAALTRGIFRNAATVIGLYAFLEQLDA